ncbi:zinc ribbon domain-containing protein [Paenibacillus sp. J22TS3]|uniref:zinc ribbon domain-containing protein n=1 Tax=Paenibacillus sp. J22TS3 TaxID=2807192 RepID=UPI001B048D10|nr:zinc ribbon domain-containing protein [Paenibacillus sp. J22TS3]GIP20739.1 hypothetical protein J22TS3_10140 [Paenibacillus sp. J22TS3]
MSFLDKFKAGMAEAGNKAKNVVETNRLKLQNNSMQHEIDKQFQAIGKMVYESVQQGTYPLPQDQISGQMDRIFELKMAIEQNLLHIDNINDFKTCKSCGSTSNVEAKFCTNCGQTYEVEHTSFVEYEADSKREISEQGRHLPDQNKP